MIHNFGEIPFGTNISFKLWQTQLYDKVFDIWGISFALKGIKNIKVLLCFCLFVFAFSLLFFWDITYTENVTITYAPLNSYNMNIHINTVQVN